MSVVQLDKAMQTASECIHTFGQRSVSEAQAVWLRYRREHGYKGEANLLCPNPEGHGNAKVGRNAVLTHTLTLSPAATSGVANTCPRSTPQCRKACVMWTAGRGIMDSVRDARACRTDFAASAPEHFLSLLMHEVGALERKGVPFGLRLNVASDVRWEMWAPSIFGGAHVRAYDYTKHEAHERDPLNGYHLTYSHSEKRTQFWVDTQLAAGRNVAMVFDTPKHMLPATWNGHTVIDGDVSDYRYDDPQGVIVGLAAKGEAKAMASGGFITAT